MMVYVLYRYLYVDIYKSAAIFCVDILYSAKLRVQKL